MAKQAQVKPEVIGNVVRFPLAQIHVIANYNVRDTFDPTNDDDDAMLVASLLSQGFQTDKPIVIAPRADGAADLIAGHRRKAAVDYLNSEKPEGWTVMPAIPAILETKGRNEVERIADLVNSNNGKRLTAGEEGAVFLRLRELGEKDVAIAQRFGISDKWVREAIRLAKADPRLKALVKAKIVSAELALKVLSVHGDNAVRVIEDAADANTGAKAGKATAASVAKVTGAKGAKPGKIKPAPLVLKPGEVQVSPTAKEGPAPKVTAITVAGPQSVTEAVKALGPFTQGKGERDMCVMDRNGAELFDAPDHNSAKILVLLLNQGYQVLSGIKIIDPVDAIREAAKPTVAETVKAAPKGDTATAKAMVAAIQRSGGRKPKQVSAH